MDWITVKEDLFNKITSKEERDFVQHMFTLSEITTENLGAKNDDVKEAVNGVDAYLKHSASANVMVTNMFGFMEGKPNLDKMGTKEYLYFVSDLKIKATVYLLRIHNFLQSWGDEVKSIYETKDSFREKISNIKVKDVRCFFEEDEREQTDERIVAAYVSENGQDETHNASKSEQYIQACKIFCQENSSEEDREKAAQRAMELEQDVLNKREEQTSKGNQKAEGVLETMPAWGNYEILAKGEHDKLLNQIYYLFDNSMREIEFTGIGWEWIWRYETTKRDLFRCVGGEEPVNPYAGGKCGKIQYENMIKAVVGHMNKGKMVKLASYSKNPYRDIYKYMIVREDIAENNPYFDVDAYNHVELANWEMCNKATFAMIKNAHINIFKDETDEKSFSDVILEQSEDDEIEKRYQFCLDVLTTSVRQKGDIRAAFQRYVSQFPDVEVKGLQRQIVSPSDEEVVMYGNTCEGSVVFYEKDVLSPEYRYENCRENVEYKVELNIFEAVWLFREVSKMVGGNKTDKMPTGLKLIREKDRYYIAYKTQKVEVRGAVLDRLRQCEVNEWSADERKAQKEKIENEVTDAVWDYFKDISADANLVSRDKIEFIKSFLAHNKRFFPNFGNVVYKTENVNVFVELGRKLFLG